MLVVLLKFLFFQISYGDDYTFIDFEDKIYKAGIQTVHFEYVKEGVRQSIGYPYIQLGSSESLDLHFDELGTEDFYYSYTIIHCQADWSPSRLSPYEYIDGFSEDDVSDYSYSYNTSIDYVHYRVSVPSIGMSPKVSGNYLLVVYEDDIENPILSKRFCVYEDAVDLSLDIERSRMKSHFNTHQTLDFSIDQSAFNIRNPYEEIKVMILQNGRWDLSQQLQGPTLVRGNIMYFTGVNSNKFRAGKEHRFFDIRNLTYYGETIFNTEVYSDTTRVTLYKDEPRSQINFFSHRDLNGQYFIENRDSRDSHLDSDYVWVYFTLAVPKKVENPIYVLGEFNKWEKQKSNKMEYDENDKIYHATQFLKQGYYDYTYNHSSVGDSKNHIEGSWYETENDYTILVYHSAFNSRADRLLAVEVVNTHDY